MPELPELEVYRERLEAALLGARPEAAKIVDPFALRTVEPPPGAVVGRPLGAVRRRGKQLLLDFEGGPSLAFHLMLAGRLHLKEAATFKPHRRRTRVAIPFDRGLVLEMTEAGTKRRAAVAVLAAGAPLPDRIDRGVEPLDPSLDITRFTALLTATNRQAKNALRDPATLSGIGNAYADEILHAARLSPLKLTAKLTEEELGRLFRATQGTLADWIERVRDACPEGLPVKQDLWRRDMAVHGRTGHPCPACGGTVAVVSFAESETNYCPGCQTGGRLLADRRLSRLGIRRLPKRIED